VSGYIPENTVYIPILIVTSEKTGLVRFFTLPHTPTNFEMQICSSGISR
jgi:hypothetical protein